MIQNFLDTTLGRPPNHVNSVNDPGNTDKKVDKWEMVVIKDAEYIELGTQ